MDVEQRERQEAPIGVFDSGLGGISVLRACADLLPQEDFLYFGDSANAPYGERSLEEVRALSMAAAIGPLVEQRAAGLAGAALSAAGAGAGPAATAPGIDAMLPAAPEAPEATSRGAI